MFLRYVEIFSQIENVNINARTAQLLQTARMYIDHVLKVANTVEVNNASEDEFLFVLDERAFEFRRYILCHTCNVSQQSFHFWKLMQTKPLAANREIPCNGEIDDLLCRNLIL